MAPIIQTEPKLKPFLTQSRLGRLYAPDARDRFHTMAAHLNTMTRAEMKVRKQSPAHGPTLDQGQTPRCVMYSAATALGASPITYKGDPLKAVSQRVTETVPQTNVELSYKDLYEWAQAHDEWPGIDYEGTSVRAGQEYLKLVGRSSGYVWARNIDEAKDYIKRIGSAPIIIGIDWMHEMNSPQLIKGSYYLNIGGAVDGGHAICVLWRDAVKKAWKLQQTWGEEFGDKGIVYLPDDSFDYLVFQANGEAVSFIENKA